MDMTINERVKLIRTSGDIHLTMEKFGERLGVKKSAISDIEHGRNNLSDQMKIAICREFHVNQVWLETGEGEMFIQSSSPELDALAHRYDLDPDAITLIEQFAFMRPDHRQIIIDYVKRVAVSMGISASTEEKEAEERAALHAELDRQLDMEKGVEGKSEVS